MAARIVTIMVMILGTMVIVALRYRRGLGIALRSSVAAWAMILAAIGVVACFALLRTKEELATLPFDQSIAEPSRALVIIVLMSGFLGLWGLLGMHSMYMIWKWRRYGGNR